MLGNVTYNLKAPVPEQTLCIGLSYVAQTAIVQGLNETSSGQMAVYYLDRQTEKYKEAFSFDIGDGCNDGRVEDNLDYLIQQPELQCIADVAVGETRENIPGAIRLNTPDGEDLIIACAGMSAQMNIVLVMALAIAICESDKKWDIFAVVSADCAHEEAHDTAESAIGIALEQELDYTEAFCKEDWVTPQILRLYQMSTATGSGDEGSVPPPYMGGSNDED